MKKRVGILISGRGSNMMALVEVARTAGYPAEIASIISSAPDAPGLAWATAQGLPARAIDHRAHPTREAFDAAVHAALTDAGVELVALAGFMRIQSKAFVERWQGRQLNIHPSLLPLFKGLHPHRQALEAGVKVSGCTVHFVHLRWTRVPSWHRRPYLCSTATHQRAWRPACWRRSIGSTRMPWRWWPRAAPASRAGGYGSTQGPTHGRTRTAASFRRNPSGW